MSHVFAGFIFLTVITQIILLHFVIAARLYSKYMRVFAKLNLSDCKQSLDLIMWFIIMYAWGVYMHYADQYLQDIYKQPLFNS